MLINASMIPTWLSLVSLAAAMVLVIAAARYAEWQALRVAPDRLHAVCASFVLLLFLQLLSIPVAEQLSLHLLGLTTVTLLIGLRFSVLVGAAALLVVMVLGRQPLVGWGLTWCVSVATPALTTRWLVAWLRRRPTRQPFVYIMGAGFAGGHLAALSTAVVALATLTLAGHQDWVLSALDNWPVLLLIAFPEGFINGTLVTAFVVLAPDLIKHFDSAWYGAD